MTSERKQKIIVAHDLSERANLAAGRAAALAARLGIRLVLVHAVDDHLPRKVQDAMRTLGKQELDKVAAELSLRLDEGRVEVEILSGSPWRAVAAAANAPDCRLVVIGSHRWRGLGELFSGSFASRLLRSVRRDALVARNPGDYARVLVGIDFSPASRAALLSAAELAPDAEIILVSAYHVPFKAFIDLAVPGDEDVKTVKEWIEREIHAQMDTFLDGLPDRLRQARRILAEGGPTVVLTAQANHQEADLVAVGSHARPALAAGFLGSTARDLVDLGEPSDVLVAR